MQVSPVLSSALLLLGLASVTLAEPLPKSKPATPKLLPPPDQILKGAAIAPGLKIDLWAAEPLLSNPVAFAFDGQGRAWVAETNRRKSSMLDIRSFLRWIPDSLAFRSVEDRIAFLKKVLPEGDPNGPKGMRDLNGDGAVDWHDLEVESEAVRLVEDSKGSGVADTARIVAQGFASLGTGIGAGIVTRNGEAWYVCAPDVWRLREDGTREPILHGLGVHIAYSGHDCHGAKLGPDGRLYFSVADCSARIEVAGRVLAPPACGAVFRCWPDGSEPELYAIGLRNPQSLVFNELGDLFTGDNNADGGDKARWIHVVEGADYGWRIGYQFLKTPKLGVWNSEGLWTMESAQSAPAILPPVTYIGHGPAGVAYYPGTGMPKEYEGAFFMADFPGGVRSLKLEPQGASYRALLPAQVLMDNSSKQMEGKLAWNLNVPDIAFGPGGGLYLLDCIDWIPGYDKFNKGRIFRVHSEAADADPIVAETRAILAEGFSARPVEALAQFLAHPDIRVRTEAQWTLAERGPDGLVAFEWVLKKMSGLARVHSVWGIGQLARKSPAAVERLRKLLKDSDAEVRAQVCKVLGENGSDADAPRIAAMLEDDAPRVRFFAIQALRRLGSEAQVPVLLKTQEGEDQKDPFLRNAALKTLSVLAKPETLSGLQSHPSTSVRLAAVLALRLQSAPGVSVFLQDTAPEVRLEAARAIYDAPGESELPALAAFEPSSGESTALVQRIQAARHRLGGKANAERLLGEAMDRSLSESARIQALVFLRQWKPEDGRDVFLGRWWPIAESRDAEPVQALLSEHMPELLQDELAAVRLTAVEMVGAFRVKAVLPLVEKVVRDRKSSGALRAAALVALSEIQTEGFGETLEAVLRENDRTLLEAAKKLLGKLSPTKASLLCGQLLDSGNLSDGQSALPTLVQLKTPEGDAILERWMDKLKADKVAPGLVLDLLEAAAKRGTPALKTRLLEFNKARRSGDKLAEYRECLEGGNAKAGLEVFREKDEVGCYRCHKAAGNGGDVGPNMDGIGARYSREYLLRAIVYPNADYAPGFENLLVTVKDGSLVAGMLESERAGKLVLTMLGTAQQQEIPLENVVKRDRLPSPMPEGLAALLTKRELRDVVEFLFRQKGAPRTE